MAKGFSCGNPVFGVHHEHFGDEIYSLVVEVLRKMLTVFGEIVGVVVSDTIKISPKIWTGKAFVLLSPIIINFKHIIIPL